MATDLTKVNKTTTLLRIEDKVLLEKIRQFVLTNYGILPDEFFSTSRVQKIAHARFLAWYILHEKEGWALAKIGEVFSRDHSTVGDGIRQAVKLNLDTEVGKLWPNFKLSTYPQP